MLLYVFFQVRKHYWNASVVSLWKRLMKMPLGKEAKHQSGSDKKFASETHYQQTLLWEAFKHFFLFLPSTFLGFKSFLWLHSCLCKLFSKQYWHRKNPNHIKMWNIVCLLHNFMDDLKLAIMWMWVSCTVRALLKLGLWKWNFRAYHTRHDW